jgi:hypothetical protein
LQSFGTTKLTVTPNSIEIAGNGPIKYTGNGNFDCVGSYNWFVGGTQLGYFDASPNFHIKGTLRLDLDGTTGVTIFHNSQPMLLTDINIGNGGVYLPIAGNSGNIYCYSKTVAFQNNIGAGNLYWSMSVQYVGSAGSFNIYNPAGVFYYLSATNVTGVWAVFSDESLKRNIKPLSPVLHKLLALNPVEFLWNFEDLDETEMNYGFIAQDVQKVIPEMVTMCKDKEGKDDKLSIEMGTLLPYLVKGMQEQNQIITNQQKSIDVLFDHVTRLTEQVNQLTRSLFAKSGE